MQRLLPLRLTLNESRQPAESTTEKIETRLDARLKVMLGRLQGAFFDSRHRRVDYPAMKRSRSFGEYQRLAQHLHRFDPESLQTDMERKAFWINIYNILIIHGVITLDIQRSVLEIVNFFGRIGYDIGDRFYSPDDIEHGILRKNRSHPTFPIRQFSNNDPRLQLAVETFDPRIHFALVCASSSCPPIEFYDAEKIEHQLDIAARSFINRNGLELDEKKRELRLSRIFQWYGRDFGDNRDQVLDYLLQFCDESLRERIVSMRKQLRIRYLPYNWDLNRRLGET